MRAELADGRILEFPDGTDPSVVQMAVKKVMGAPQGVSDPATTPNYDPYTIENIVGSAIEPMVSLGTGVAGSVAGGLYGLGTLATGGTSDEATANIKSVVDAMTYKPRSGGGQIAKEAIAYPLEKWAEGTEKLGTQQLDITEGSPEKKAGWATATKTVADIIPMLLGAKAISGKPLTIGGKQPLQPIESAIKVPARMGSKVVKAIAEKGKNVFPRHKERVGRLLDELAGSDRLAIIGALEKAKPGETSGQAASPVGRAEFSAVEKLMQKQAPTKYSEVGRIRESQQAARIRELEKEGKTPEAVADAMLKRTEKADPLYKAGREGKAVGVDKIVSGIDKLMKDNPGNLELLNELAKVKGGLTKDGISRTSGQEVLSSVDSLKAAIANKDNAFIKGQLTKIKNDIIESVPKYKAGEVAFKEMSEPVNQMQVFQQLVKELAPRLGSKDRATQFVNALENARLTMKRASDGTPRFESLDKVLTPKQIAVTKKLRAELDRDVSLKQQGTAGYAKLTKVVGDELAPPEMPGMLSSKVMIFRNIMRRLEGSATEGTMKKLEQVWDKPKEVAKIMQKFNPEGRKILNSYLSGKATAMAAGSEESK